MSDTHYDVKEAAEKIGKMTPDEWRKVGRYAYTLAQSMDGCDFQDLMNEAVLRTLEGTRSWKRGMVATAHLFGVMKSILYSSRKAAEFETAALQQFDAEYDDETWDTDEDERPSPKDVVETIKRSLNLDSQESAVLDALAAGDDPLSIQKSLSISKAKYHQILRRLVTKIDQLK